MILNWNSEKKSWKFLENFSFYQNFQFLGSTTLHISCHKLAELWPRTNFLPPKYPSKIPLKVSRRHTYENPSRLGDIREDIRGGQNDPLFLTPLGVYVDQKSLVFPGLNLNKNSKVRAVSSVRTFHTHPIWHDLIHTHVVGRKVSIISDCRLVP